MTYIELAIYDKPVRIFSPVCEEPDSKAIAQIMSCMKHDKAVAGALMADHHLGYSMPIGGVIAYEGAISPSGVGYDIGCGNKVVRTYLTVRDVAEDLDDIMLEIQSSIAFGMGRKNQHPVYHPLFDDPAWELLNHYAPGLRDKAQAQLGTVGSGNHYVDLLRDEEDDLWVANHFGSRGFGHTIATGFLNLAAGKGWSEKGKDSEEPTVLSTDSQLGTEYLECMRLAGAYAYAGRTYVIEQVLEILGDQDIHESVHNHHNYAWQENGYVVVRKGATPLTEEPAFIGGSMGDYSAIITGTGEDIGNLASAPHGAGRQMSRTKAAGKWKKVVDDKGRKRRVRDASTAAIDWKAVQASLRDEGTVVLGAGADEAPGAYKSLLDVLAAHPNIKIQHKLWPVGVVMAGEDVFDPYKD